MSRNVLPNVMIGCVILNVVFTVFNAYAGNMEWAVLNAVTAVFCQIGYLRLSNDK